MKTRFKSEKHAREETIGRASTMANDALREKREFTQREARKVDLLLTTAESLKLGVDIPRDPAGLVAIAKQSTGPNIGAEVRADAVVSLRKAKKS